MRCALDFWAGAFCIVAVGLNPTSGAQSNDEPFVFCTVKYANNGWDEPLGFGWSTDWPDSGHALMLKLAERTHIAIAREADGTPKQALVALTDPELTRYPIVLISDAGTVGLSEDERVALRRYLSGGGLLLVDDFWGDVAWKNWAYEIGHVFPPEKYPIVDLPANHVVFNRPFRVGKPEQMPGLQFWAATKGESTAERGDAHPVHYRGIFDRDGRLMVFMAHNTDLADGWEASLPTRDAGGEKSYRERFSDKALELAFNLITYARLDRAER